MAMLEELRRDLRQTDRTALIVFIALMGFFAVFLFIPILYIFIGAFFVEGVFTTYYFTLMFTDPVLFESLRNSLIIGVYSTILTSAIAVPLAFLMVRYEFPGKRFFQGFLLIPLVMPPFVGAIGMKQLFARYGSINLFLMSLGLMKEPFDWLGQGIPAIVILEALHLYPYLYLNTAAALANIDPTLEEQAQVMGATGFRLFRTVTFPLMLPGFLAGSIVTFVWAFTDLGTPLIFDYPYVLPRQIFSKVRDIYINPIGYAMTVLALAVAVVAVVVARRYGSMRSYEMLGRGHITPRIRRIGDGKRRWSVIPVYISLLLVVFLALVPQISVIVTSVAKTWFFSILPQEYTLDYYYQAVTHPLTVSSVANSFIYSIGSTAFDLVLGIVIAWLLARKTFPGKDILDSAAMLPLALPGIIIAFGYISVFSGTILNPLDNPIPLLILSYSVRRLPYTVRAAYAGFQQTSVSLEEASQSVGASAFQTMIHITAPLIMANVLAGGIISFSSNMMEVSDSMVLAMTQPYYPITKAIYNLDLRLGDGPYIASALGILATLLTASCLLLANKLLGRRMGELFRA
jgi:iron(III) transport system permease protein